MSWELQLVRSIIETKDLKRATKLGLESQVFGTVEGKTAFDYLISYAARPEHFGEVASMEMFSEAFRNMPLPSPVQSLDALIAKVKEDHLKRQLRVIREAMDMGDNSIEENPYGCLGTVTDELRSLYGKLRTGTTHDFAEEALDMLMTEYAATKEQGGVKGIKWPWDEVTERVGGIEEGMLVIIAGIAKSGKTWLAMLICVLAYAVQGRRVLIFSREMSLVQLFARAACIITELDYDAWRKAAFTNEEEELFFAMLNYLKDERGGVHRRLIIEKGLSENVATSLQMLESLIAEHEPDLIFVDSAYQLAEDQDWKVLGKLTKGLMVMAANTKVPIIATMQDNERKAVEDKGRGTASAAGTPTAVRDCHLYVKVVNNGNGFASVTFAAGREGSFKDAGVRIHFKPCTNMRFVDRKVEKLNEGTEQETSGQRPQERQTLFPNAPGRRSAGVTGP